MINLFIILLTSVFMGVSHKPVKTSSPPPKKFVLKKNTYKPLKPKSLRNSKVFPISNRVRYKVLKPGVFALYFQFDANSRTIVIAEVKSGKVVRVIVGVKAGKVIVLFEDSVSSSPTDGVDAVYVWPNRKPYCVKATCPRKKLQAANEGLVLGLALTKFREHLWYYLKNTSRRPVGHF